VVFSIAHVHSKCSNLLSRRATTNPTKYHGNHRVEIRGVFDESLFWALLLGRNNVTESSVGPDEMGTTHFHNAKVPGNDWSVSAHPMWALDCGSAFGPK
jgi:hypothetical protein